MKLVLGDNTWIPFFNGMVISLFIEIEAADSPDNQMQIVHSGIIRP
jgi:hypothetical protein